MYLDYNRKTHTHICTYSARAIQMHTHIRYMSQETLQKPRIHQVSNPQFIGGIVEDICRIIKGYPRNHQGVSAESSKGTCEFVARGECTPMLSMLAWLSNSSTEEEDR